MTLSEVHSSSVTSACVDVSLPYLNDPETLHSSNEQSADTQKTFEFDEDKSDQSDKNEVDLAQLNLMQILHAESPQPSLLSVPESCDLHRASPVCIPDVDDGGDLPSDEESNENSCSEQKNSSYIQTGVDAMAEQQKSERDERSDATDFGLINKEEQLATAHQPNDKPSDIDDSCTQCEVYTMTFGGLYTVTTTTPSSEIDDNGKSHIEEKKSETYLDSAVTCMEDKQDLKQSADSGIDAQLTSKTDSTPYEIYTVNFGGLYTFSTASPGVDECDDRGKLCTEASSSLEQQSRVLDVDSSSQGCKSAERALNPPSPDLQSNDKTDSTPYEMYTMSFGGLYAFSSTALDDDVTETKELMSQTGERLSEMGESSERDLDLVVPSMEDKKDKQSYPTVCTPYEVFTVSFGGLHAFTATPSVDNGDVQEQRDILKVEQEKDCRQMTDNQAVRTPYEVHTMTFGGLYTFTATLSPPIHADGAPPMRAA